MDLKTGGGIVSVGLRWKCWKGEVGLEPDPRGRGLELVVEK